MIRLSGDERYLSNLACVIKTKCQMKFSVESMDFVSTGNCVTARGKFKTQNGSAREIQNPKWRRAGNSKPKWQLRTAECFQHLIGSPLFYQIYQDSRTMLLFFLIFKEQSITTGVTCLFFLGGKRSLSLTPATNPPSPTPSDKGEEGVTYHGVLNTL